MSPEAEKQIEMLLDAMVKNSSREQREKGKQARIAADTFCEHIFDFTNNLIDGEENEFFKVAGEQSFYIMVMRRIFVKYMESIQKLPQTQGKMDKILQNIFSKALNEYLPSTMHVLVKLKD